MKIQDSYRVLCGAQYSDALARVMPRFVQTLNTPIVSAITTIDGGLFMQVYGTQDGTNYTNYYYDINAAEYFDNPLYKKLSHISYNPMFRRYARVSCGVPVLPYDPYGDRRTFEIWQSRFSRRQTLIGYNPIAKKIDNFYYMCYGKIHWRCTHDICGRRFLEFGVTNNDCAPGPILLETTGRPLTRTVGTHFSILPAYGVIVQRVAPNASNPNMPTYNIYDVTSPDNRILASGVVDIDYKTGRVCGKTISCINELRTRSH